VRNFHAITLWIVIISPFAVFPAYIQRVRNKVPYWKREMQSLRSHVNLCLFVGGGYKRDLFQGGSFLESRRLSVNFTAFALLLNIRRVPSLLFFLSDLRILKSLFVPGEKMILPATLSVGRKYLSRCALT